VGWLDVAALTASLSGAGDVQDAEYVTAGFLRFKVQLNISGPGSGEIAVATFDLHANLTRK
jgi:hypothetical protein